ncbi:uncharacterized protein LOC123698735 [Colias croceus]|uniref:uncharacterized protein LOC123698735 n=1 Tax=Colias crocea TaxID=72248 RepID=UPI001E27EA88|nr:uncharacterized protein LOC123698735 [Colias croceus]
MNKAAASDTEIKEEASGAALASISVSTKLPEFWTDLPSYLKSISKEDLLKHLDTILREGEDSDAFLYEELQLLKANLLDSVSDAKQLIQYILKNNLEEIYPNVYIAIRIMLTVPVSTTSAERSFSKLKLIKTYLRSTMSQERLSALSVLLIEEKKKEAPLKQQHS